MAPQSRSGVGQKQAAKDAPARNKSAIAVPLKQPGKMMTLEELKAQEGYIPGMKKAEF